MSAKKTATVAESGTERFIPLNKLKKSPNNARKTPHSEASIEAYEVVVDRLELVRQWVNTRNRERKVWIVLIRESQSRRFDAEPEALRVTIKWRSLGRCVQELKLVKA